ncbi:hypothetical protein Kpol_1066p11 [Vanderwaltozyma polyspora DSM 70294]|uniref:Uncharacterized protein n=1 Tax=Vanderwaltozyma polyspora (strain ATCC 22028 / DSM 70294 / BCRC 21397 / CBS 2163 / NBRC 10782 / NRRL Y-8283 / UCD 57-17) TaxID=436907 RepID=A7TMN3_VANPO|nr:uncharacterized protein Kpol_1066p11 [Vanderwaltozyma polyspora DSM 70294]EDO16447.1 hypothetical protein Kpol_1066p11 [Vanderwaltozyma polyspora DSM 70294]
MSATVETRDEFENVIVCDLKLVLLGDSSVGKTSIVGRLTTGNFINSNATIGAAFVTTTIEVDDEEMINGGNNGMSSKRSIKKRVNFEIWDTAGQERYRSLAPMYYRNTDVALIVFDLSRPQSFKGAQSWIEELNSYVEESSRGEIITVLVGSKKDIEIGQPSMAPIIDNFDKLKFTKNLQKVSAKTGEGIQELFENIVRELPNEKFRPLGQPNGEPEHHKHIKLDSKTRSWTRITDRTACEC